MPYNPNIHHLETEVRLNENMCIFNVFKMYSVILFFCKVNTTYLKFEIFLVVVLYPRHIIMYQFRTEKSVWK